MSSKSPVFKRLKHSFNFLLSLAAKFRSTSAVNTLLDLLSDDDNNVRTVAAIALARTGVKEKKVIKALLKTLNNPDRLVRESGCLALGHLQAPEAVTRIVLLW